MQLAEKLSITDRAISKWETGKSMPDSSIMLDLCDVLKITVNDLLSGEVVSMEKQDKELENNLLEMVKEKQEADRRMLTLEVVFGIASITIMLALCIFGAYAPLEDWQRVVLIVIGFVPVLVFTPFAILIEQKAGYYECKKCGHRYVPKYATVFFAMHKGRTRYMKCPKCGERSWQKKKIDKE
jgi:transcriptional regulator with XRE-family HTH domain/DNA-directed RNA polymerase subunit RPC12/RpoP